MGGVSVAEAATILETTPKAVESGSTAPADFTRAIEKMAVIDT